MRDASNDLVRCQKDGRKLSEETGLNMNLKFLRVYSSRLSGLITGVSEHVILRIIKGAWHETKVRHSS